MLSYQQFDLGIQPEILCKIPAWAPKQKPDSEAQFQKGLHLYIEELQFSQKMFQSCQEEILLNYKAANSWFINL